MSSPYMTRDAISPRVAKAKVVYVSRFYAKEQRSRGFYLQFAS